jgi:hypothetical protein
VLIFFRRRQWTRFAFFSDSFNMLTAVLLIATVMLASIVMHSEMQVVMKREAANLKKRQAEMRERIGMTSKESSGFIKLEH